MLNVKCERKQKLNERSVQEKASEAQEHNVCAHWGFGNFVVQRRTAGVTLRPCDPAV